MYNYYALCFNFDWIKLMKKLFLILSAVVSINAFANCDYVVINNSFVAWEAHTRSEQLGGMAMAPSCADLPDTLKNGAYAKYCNNVQYDQRKTIYGAYTTNSCKNLIGTKWSVQQNGKIMGTHIIEEADLVDIYTIILNYPSQFSD